MFGTKVALFAPLKPQIQNLDSGPGLKVLEEVMFFICIVCFVHLTQTPSIPVQTWLSGVKNQNSISVPGASGMRAGPMRVAVLDALLSCNVNAATIMDNLGQALIESLKGARFER